MEKTSQNYSTTGSSDYLSRCPICFKNFSTTRIQAHASTCTGQNDSIKEIDVLKENKDIVSKNNSIKPTDTETKPTDTEIKPIASIFKARNDRKRQVDTDSCEASTGNISKTSKKEVQFLENEQHSSILPKTSKTVRQPLADLMRPSLLEHYMGQEQAIGKTNGKFLRLMIQSISNSDNIASFPSMIIWGPPGCGKTSLVNVISSEVSKSKNGLWRFKRLSACDSGVAQVKTEVSNAKNERNLFKRSTMLFIDEIHRFNKTQQDTLLPHVEDGTITLIGATTENPSFSINSALLSRCRVIVLEKLSPKVIFEIVKRASEKLQIRMKKECDDKFDSVNEQNYIIIEEKAISYLSNFADGDARTALNCLELSYQITKERVAEVKSHNISVEQNNLHVNVITTEDIKQNIKRSHILYDKKGNEHYNCASALQKSIRGSDDSAALYWLMRMFDGGEDPLFIARRLVRTASEDIGLGDPNALGVAVAAMQGCQLIGRPECDVILAQCTTYLARAKKSHEVYNAMNKVRTLIRESDDTRGLPPVPLHLRNATSSLDRSLGFGVGYVAQNFQSITYMPDELKEETFFDV